MVAETLQFEHLTFRALVSVTETVSQWALKLTSQRPIWQRFLNTILQYVCGNLVTLCKFGGMVKMLFEKIKKVERCNF